MKLPESETSYAHVYHYIRGTLL